MQAPVGTFDEQLLTCAEECFLHQIVTDPIRFRQGQQASVLDVILVKFPH